MNHCDHIYEAIKKEREACIEIARLFTCSSSVDECCIQHAQALVDRLEARSLGQGMSPSELRDVAESLRYVFDEEEQA